MHKLALVDAKIVFFQDLGGFAPLGHELQDISLDRGLAFRAQHPEDVAHAFRIVVAAGDFAHCDGWMKGHFGVAALGGGCALPLI